MKTHNLFVPPRGDWAEEISEELLHTNGFMLERIFTAGQATPEDQWYDSPRAEWVVLLSGAARLKMEEGTQMIDMRPGDYLCIPAHCRHRVEWADPDLPTVWLALHYQADADECAGGRSRAESG